MIRRPPRSTLSSSSAASDVYKRQVSTQSTGVVLWLAMEPVANALPSWMFEQAQEHPPMALPIVDIPPDAATEVAIFFGEQCCVGTPARFGPLWSEDGVEARVMVADPLLLDGDVANPAPEGGVLVCERGGVAFVQKVGMAENAGAAGLIVIQNSDNWPHTMSDSTGARGPGIPAALISRGSGKALLDWVKAHPFEELTVKVASRELKCCSICQESFDGEAARLPCRHCFHQDCIARWLSKTRSCPLCRHLLPTDSSCDQLFWRDELKVADAIHDRGAPSHMFG
eukprot:TRINITY_DN8247_c0_g1_i4.p1 TRINITY_DN8247_c0_g1~~TRINITY_DN8247_c0_g1_i4.p1  ORF type:complete len:284 (+),score=56.46 TRINITY_DN8247_c0_g1_i4:107-958(+)